MSNGKIAVPEFQKSFSAAAERFTDTAYVMQQCSDCFKILRLPEMMGQMDFADIEKHGLEIRLFNKDGEKKWMRPSIAGEFFFVRERMEDGSLTRDVDYWDEEQFLDIDTVRSNVKEQKVVTTGGGEYLLPILGKNGISDYKDVKLAIRNYLDYEPDTGRAFVKDWRIVGFVG